MTLFFSDIQASGVTIPPADRRDNPVMECYKSIVPWIVAKVHNNVEILNNLNDDLYKDRSSTLMRLYVSATYYFKSFLSSTLNIFRLPEGFGFDGIFGIPLVHRAVLKSDDYYSRFYPRIGDGFTVQRGEKTRVDLLMPLPNFSPWGKTKIESLLTPSGHHVSIIFSVLYSQLSIFSV